MEPESTTALPSTIANSGRAVFIDLPVMFRLTDDCGWPEYPAEMISGRYVGPALVEVTGVPWFADGLSRGDVVAVSFDGMGPVAEEVVGLAGHTTVRVVAAESAELADLAGRLRAMGATVLESEQSLMIAVDIPPVRDLGPIIALLKKSESITMAFEISCGQH